MVYEGRKIPQKTTSDAINQYLEQSLIGLDKEQQEEVEVLKDKISKVLEELKTHIDDIDFDDLNARLG